MEEPTALNSNLLPVNANGEVLFLSVLSCMISGIELTILMELAALGSSTSFMFMIPSKIFERVDPEKMDITDGGASWPPSLQELSRVQMELISR